VLVALGLTDVGGLTLTVVARLLATIAPARIEVVLGEQAPSRAAMTELAASDARIALRVQTHDMARLMLSADIAVGAGGSSTWERSVLGLPSVMLVMAPNQRSAAQAMVAASASLVVDAEDGQIGSDFDSAVTALSGSAPLRAKLSRHSAALCDGNGASRAAEALLSLLPGRSKAP
jgi:spore coat polysaccharide biosynthesis predicted glycosyltransferase SpsG